MERQLSQERAYLAELAAQLPPDVLVPSPLLISTDSPGFTARYRSDAQAARAGMSSNTQTSSNIDKIFVNAINVTSQNTPAAIFFEDSSGLCCD